MKKLSFSMLAMAGLLLVGCADKDVIAEGGGQQEEGLSDGYMALAINLPTTPSTRAINDDFDDGDVSEYYVKDLALLIFEDGESAEDKGEDKAKLIWANDVSWDYKLDDGPDTPTDNITTSYRVVTPISGHTAGRKLYALAVLNYKNVLTVDGLNTKITTPSTPIRTLKDFHTAISGIDLTTDQNKSSYFFMTNAILSTVPGGTHNPTEEYNGVTPKVFQLAEIEEDKIKKTKEEAAKDPAGEILVERAVAKATLSCNATAIGGVQEESENENGEKGLVAKTLEIDKVEWVIDNIEPSTYVARNPGNGEYIGYTSKKFDPAGYYRFVSHTSTQTNSGKWTVKDFYRTYWCEDPHYEDEMDPVENTEYDKNPLWKCDDFVEANTVPLYCYENTFNVEHQLYKNTTRAIVKVTLKNTNPFYTINNSSIYYTQETLEKNIIGDIIINPEIGFISLLQDAITAGSLSDIDYDFLKNKIAITFSTTEVADADVIIKSIALTEAGKTYFSATTGDVTFKEGTVAKIDEALTKFMGTYDGTTFQRYVDGVMYYDARFQHFADTYTPESENDLAPWNYWEEEKGVTAPSSADAYPDDAKSNAEQNYLGRYGMVRNNWYDVKVESFNKLGSPISPKGHVSTDTTTDDNLNDYISVRIHVLSWAKRTQSWKF